ALVIIDPDAEVPPVTITDVTASAVFLGGRENDVSVTLATVTDDDADAVVEGVADEGWNTEQDAVTVPGGEDLTVQVQLTPPLQPSLATPTVQLVDLPHAHPLNVVSVPAAEDAVLALDAGSASSPVLDGYARLSPEETWSAER